MKPRKLSLSQWYAIFFIGPMLPTLAVAAPASDIADRVLPSVVLIALEDEDGEQVGVASGFVVADGIVATNHHVIEGAAGGHVKPVSTGREKRAGVQPDGERARDDDTGALKVQGVVATAPGRDLALLQVAELDRPPLPIADTDELSVGDKVYVAGNPHGLTGTFSDGIVSSIRDLGDDQLLQITAPISAGSSGGPVLNTEGQVIGVAVAQVMEGQNFNFAVPSPHLLKLIDQPGKLQRWPGLQNGKTTDKESEASGFWKRFAEAQRKAAREGDADGMVNFGMMYALGRGVTQNHRKAVRWFRKAAEEENTKGMTKLGSMYADGLGVPQNHRKAVRWYRKAAEKGNTEAMVKLGAAYSVGLGVPQDGEKAVRWYRKAAEDGNTEAMTMLGNIYAAGLAVPQNYEKAVGWYQKAAEKGNTEAMAKLGTMHETGLGVPVNHQKAVRWYQKAAGKGNTEAMFRLGAYYTVDRGVPQNYRKAVRWYRKAAEKGNTEAMAKLGSMNADGLGVPQNEEKAVRWFRKAAEEGNTEAMAKLGAAYSAGLGVPQNEEKAARWSRKAAEDGNTDAMIMLGFHYAGGRGVPQNEEKAVRWYRKAAEKGNTEAMYYLAEMYAAGRGVPQNGVEAYAWSSTAGAFGSEKARDLRDQVAETLTDAARLEGQERAEELFQKFKQRNDQ